MAKRIRLGLIYSYNEHWIGGTYYVENLVRSLNLLEEGKKPYLVVLIEKQSDRDNFLGSVQYPYLEFKFYNKSPRGLLMKLNNLFYKITGTNLIDFRITDKHVDFLFPLRKENYFFEKVTNIIFWIPDLQEKLLPAFFSKEELASRDSTISKIIDSKCPIVFSSNAAADDFRAYYNCTNDLYVIHFAVHHPQVLEKDDLVNGKFDIDAPYFIVCNQFWQHKNHKILIEALAEFQEAIPFKVVFTGKPSDYRNTHFYNELMELIKKKGVSNYIIIVGFIEREEQIVLMKNALAVIQPSLFEGWSTVVEDAKALGKRVIVSDLKVHREQVDSGYFFNPEDASELKSILEQLAGGEPDAINDESEAYKGKQLMFGKEFYNLIKDQNG